VPRRVNAPLRRLPIDWICLLINPQPPRALLASGGWRFRFGRSSISSPRQRMAHCLAQRANSQSHNRRFAEAIRDVPESTVCHRWDCLGGSLDERFYRGCHFLSRQRPARCRERRSQSICGSGDTAGFRLDGCRFNPAWQRGRILVRRLRRLTDRCEDLSSQLLYRQHCNNRSIMRSQASNWSSAMNSSGLWP
jgi:hypothetical protein